MTGINAQLGRPWKTLSKTNHCSTIFTSQMLGLPVSTKRRSVRLELHFEHYHIPVGMFHTLSLSSQ